MWTFHAILGKKSHPLFMGIFNFSSFAQIVCSFFIVILLFLCIYLYAILITQQTHECNHIFYLIKKKKTERKRNEIISWDFVILEQGSRFVHKSIIKGLIHGIGPSTYSQFIFSNSSNLQFHHSIYVHCNFPH